MRMRSDADPELRAEELRRCDRAFRRSLNLLRGASGRLEIKWPIILPSHSIYKAHRFVFPPNSTSFLLIDVYHEKISTAVKAKDAQLAARLGIQLGQFVAGMALHDLVQRGHCVTISGGKRNPVKKEQLESFKQSFELYVWGTFREYYLRQRENDADANMKEFRESVIRPLIPQLARGRNAEFRKFGKKLMGTAGTNGDGIMSAKQLQRIVGRITAWLGPY
jgi:hypothetical protein